MPVNPKKYIDKLIQGLETKGRHYNYSMKRFYSERVGRYVTKYTLEDMQNKGRKLEVYNKLEILKFLVREWSDVNGTPVPEACMEALDEAKPNSEVGIGMLHNFRQRKPR